MPSEAGIAHPPHVVHSGEFGPHPVPGTTGVGTLDVPSLLTEWGLSTAPRAEQLRAVLAYLIEHDVRAHCNWWGNRFRDSSGALRGKLTLDGREEYAPRAALMIAVGPPPPDRPCALHSPTLTCSTLCLNPIGHVRWGSRSENAADAVAEGAYHDTEWRRVDPRRAWAIPRLRKLGLTQRRLAELYGVSQACIQRIAAGASRASTTALSADELIATTRAPEHDGPPWAESAREIEEDP